MPKNADFLSKVARKVSAPSREAPSGVKDSILTVTAGSYGFRPSVEEATMPTGFDPQAAALFETIVEAAFLVAQADGVFDEAERRAFRTVVVEACRGAVGVEQVEALMSDLAEMLEEDGVDKRIAMVARTVSRPDHQREVLRIAAFLAVVSDSASEVEREVLTKLSNAFGLPEGTVDSVVAEVRDAVAEVEAQGS
jgi:uncharacterized membrane protein YebE (DUF533 family)